MATFIIAQPVKSSKTIFDGGIVSCAKMLSNLIRGVGCLSRSTGLTTTSSVCCSLRDLHITPVLCAEPLKKRKRLDPQILRMREQRKIKKLEKGIRQLKRHAKKLKPIDEMEVSPRLQKELGLRQRKAETIPESILNFREDLMRVWSNIRSLQYSEEAKTVQAMIDCQIIALEELRLTNSTLYDAAVQPDEQLLPIKFRALTETPPIDNYNVPDGKYIDVSKNWRPKPVVARKTSV
ncbi:39S ribosomal protein L40 [Tropilaelaps mercedesae]|uniref:Large ribosomal subunit protein mL40 n=1 Tax=Tropilaelaps mercedesae TaxID=418985 RepID=A0A1V9XAB8_9ACAR|nr:39S ribosomal protein L40 [Tropilaelaps mercedesae]